MAVHDFKIGHTYVRKDIHPRFGGGPQCGISVPARHRAGWGLIFAFTGPSGRRHGFLDGWTKDHFRYFGEGQIGDMTMTGGNEKIANQKRDGKDILLFEALGSGQVKFCGTFDCAGYSCEQAPDRENRQRRAIVFRLVPRPQGD